MMADARATVGQWVGEQDGRLQWLPPEAGAFCCTRLNPDNFGRPGVRRFYDRLAEQRTAVAPGPWFGDSAHVMRIGLAYETDGQLEKGLEDHLRRAAALNALVRGASLPVGTSVSVRRLGGCAGGV